LHYYDKLAVIGGFMLFMVNLKTVDLLIRHCTLGFHKMRAYRCNWSNQREV